MERDFRYVVAFVAVPMTAAWTSWSLLAQRRTREARRVALRVRRSSDSHQTARRIRNLPPLLVILATIVALPKVASAQVVRLGVIMDLPRAALDSSWSDDPHQVERAYCIVNYSTGVTHVSRSTPVQDDTVFRVWSIKDADANDAGPNSVDFQCPHGVPEMHTHTPSTCSGDDVRTCVVGGLNAYSCQPSRQDFEKLVRRGDPFAVIQCDRRAFRFYYPSEYVPVEASRLAAGASSNKPNANIPLVFQKEQKKTP